MRRSDFLVLLILMCFCLLTLDICISGTFFFVGFAFVTGSCFLGFVFAGVCTLLPGFSVNLGLQVGCGVGIILDFVNTVLILGFYVWCFWVAFGGFL